MPTKEQKRKLSRERRILRSQARWLQKALFALSKAEDEQGKLDELRDGDVDAPFDVTVGGTSHEIGEITSALKDTVEAWMEEQRTALRDRRTTMLRS
jgi:hypothetical protein